MVVSINVSACRAAYSSGTDFLKDVIFHKIVARHVGLNAVAFRYCVLRTIEIAVTYSAAIGLIEQHVVSIPVDAPNAIHPTVISVDKKNTRGRGAGCVYEKKILNPIQL